MPITRKRKAQSEEQSKQTTSTASRKSISHYGRVTKTQKGDQTAKKRKVLLDGAVKVVPMQEIPEISLQDGSESQHPMPAAQAPTASLDQSTTRSTRKRRNEDTTETIETPQHKRFKNAIPPTPAETPSKGALHLFDRLSIRPSIAEPSAGQQVPYDTPPLTPRSFADLSQSQSIIELPPAVHDIIQLFSAFLTSTSLYYAQNGSGSNLEIAFALQNITKTWKRRLVTELDLRRILGVLGDDSFTIVDNGDGLICLEQGNITATGHFNQPESKKRFERQLQVLWRKWISVSATRKQDVSAFVEQLPLAVIQQGEFTQMKGVKSSKGQQRLDDLKRGAAEARSQEMASQKSVVAAEAKSLAGVSSRGSSLLDRILAKEALISSRGNGPTQEETDRRVALNRVEEIIRVLDVLAGSRPRVSFSTLTMVSNLQNSLRNPISREEAERCLKLMASEVTPSFVSMISSGQVKGIVITRGGRPSNAELRQRLERAGV